METTNEQLKEQLLKDIKDLSWHIDYHEKALAEFKLKMQIAEYSLRSLTEIEYGTVQ
jgi:hypothetical protein